MADTISNKWLEGPYAPIPGDVTALDLEVVGTLPPELDGRYLRNGPNPITPVDPATHHWFVGDAMVHGLRLRDGRAEWYRARMVRSDAASARRSARRRRPASATAAWTPPTRNVIGLGGRTFAIVEAGARPVELSDELDTVAALRPRRHLPNGYTAHPKVDPATGELHAISYHWALPHLQYTVIGADGVVQQVEPIEVPDGPMVHDCSITERWVVVYDLPVTFDLDGAMSGSALPLPRGRTTGPPRVGLVPLGGRGDQVRWFDVAPCYVFHPLNAHDDGDKVVLDVVRYDRMFDASTAAGPTTARRSLWRWTIDTATGTVHEEQLSDVAMEFPRVDERLVGRPAPLGLRVHRARRRPPATASAANLVRIDAKGGDAAVIDLGPGRISGEWVHVPRADGAAEDDGWLLSLVHDTDSDRGELVVLPAADPADGPVARVLLPNRVPLGFHGNWVPTPA